MKEKESGAKLTHISRAISAAPGTAQFPSALTCVSQSSKTLRKRGMSHGGSQRARGPFALWHHLPSANAQPPALEAPCLLNHKARGKD